jgi:hypothetical protein
MLNKFVYYGNDEMSSKYFLSHDIKPVFHFHFKNFQLPERKEKFPQVEMGSGFQLKIHES